ncbi:hypothetical protein HYFRA_00011346 [Hymenoscyphus fraxineus]|uniref:F-box domain-containing protein n=1 Tax=Hymenoscyphus fraxineus TaxID=746836 RepID=A0A9N9L1J1_9HELO|nr:hypothetical protein HYFRA_00011346 [Hymenoscyphus fraxineus]
MLDNHFQTLDDCAVPDTNFGSVKRPPYLSSSSETRHSTGTLTIAPSASSASAVQKDHNKASPENQPQPDTNLDMGPKGHIIKLPVELQKIVAENITPQEVVCLALTCKALYHVHKDVITTVPLYQPRYQGKQLCSLLRDWIDPEHLMVLDTHTSKFVTWECREKMMGARFNLWQKQGSHGAACKGCFHSVWSVVAEVRSQNIISRTWVLPDRVRNLNLP